MEKMVDYGDRVQFSLVSGGPEPNYQIINTLGKSMAFDRKHHLLRPEADEFAGGNATRIFTLEQVKAAISGARSTSTTSRTTRVARAAVPRTTMARQEELFAAQRYEYFRTHRQTLPPTISLHTEEITELMKKGKSVEEAFGEVVSKYY
jgi:hypothetical protein